MHSVDTMKAIANRVKSLMEKRGISNREARRIVAKETGISYGTMKRWLFPKTIKRLTGEPLKENPFTRKKREREEAEALLLASSEEKKIALSQLHREPKAAFKGSEKVVEKPEPEIQSVLNNGRWSCPRCKAHVFLEAAEIEGFIFCQLCQILLSVPDNERGEINPVDSLGPNSWMVL